MLRLVHFWRIAIVIAALTIFFLLPTFAAHAMGVGSTTSCRTYLANRTKPDIRQYILGFATGANEISVLMTGKNYLDKVAEQTVLDIVANYCTRTPDVSVHQAARNYLQNLK
jgi:hypothetical protein